MAEAARDITRLPAGDAVAADPYPWPYDGDLRPDNTALVIIEAVGHYRTIGQTVDDAIGEAFDKTAKLLGLPYPGGPEIERLAPRGAKGTKNPFHFKPGRVKDHPFSFSFSGLKTAVLYAWQKSDKSEQTKADIAYAFQQAAFADILQKTIYASSHFGLSRILFGGGVTQSQTLRSLLETALADKQLYFPELALTLDNAAMIAGLGWAQYRARGPDPLTLQPTATLPIG